MAGAPIRAEARVFAETSVARIPERPEGFTGTAELAAETEQRLQRERARYTTHRSSFLAAPEPQPE